MKKIVIENNFSLYRQFVALVLVCLLQVFLYTGQADAQYTVTIDSPYGAGYSDDGWQLGWRSRYTYTNDALKQATFRPTLDTTGIYRVSERTPAMGSDRQAVYTINHANGTNGRVINQTSSWQYQNLGDFCFQAGSSGSVTITRAPGRPADQYTTANQVEFRLISAENCLTATTHAITASATPGGTIDPDGVTNVVEGDDQIYTITPGSGYFISDVVVDGVSVGTVGSYTFPNVTTPHTIHAIFTAFYEIDASASSGGIITPSGNIQVNPGDDQSFTITANPGYLINDVFVNGVSVGAVGTYDFINVSAEHDIEATFRSTTHTITTYLGANGSINPVGPVTVADMANQSFVITADPTYLITNLLIDGISIGVSGVSTHTYDFINVVEDHTINASFATTHDITAAADTGGSITPSGVTTVNSGDTPTYTIASDNGYLLVDVLVDGVSVGAVTSYTFDPIIADHGIKATFIPGHIISATSSSGGSISPSGTLELLPGSNQTFAVIPDTCFDIDDVLVDAASEGPMTSYSFTSISSDHTIHSDFTPRPPLTVTSTAGAHADISPAGVLAVPCGNNQQFTVTTDPDLKDLYIQVDENYYQILEDGLFKAGSPCIQTSNPNECIYTLYSVEEDHQVTLVEVFNLADFPLDIQTRPAPPNIMFVLDDSGSMDWEFMTTETDGKFAGEYYIYDPGDNAYSDSYILGDGDDDEEMWKAKWYDYNKLYYNPSVDYGRWPNRGDANVPPTATRSHPMSSTHTLRLDNAYDTFDGVTIPNAHYYMYSTTENKPYLIIIDYGSTSIKYYQVSSVSGSGSGEELDNLVLDATPPADVVTARTYADEMQNFANWFSFYRRRELAATMSVATTIDQLSNVYIGIRTINSDGSYGIQKELTPVRVLYLDANDNFVYEDETANLLDSLYALEIDEYGTPLRTGLQKVGQYFDQTDAADGDLSGNPWFTKETGGECQQSFAVVMTDGFYNGSDPAGIGNEDNNEGQPYEDNYSDTLADLAIYYYQDHDLVADTVLADRVPGAATYQHLNTYGVSFGVEGTLEQAHPIDWYTTVPGCLSGCNYPVWPDPDNGDSEKIDDLWHSSINGRGTYVNASNPSELVDALLDVISDIVAQDGSASSVSVNGDELYMSVGSTVRMYQTRYKTPSWTGDIFSYGINADGTVETNNPVWSAAEVLDTNLNYGANVGSRLIATLKQDPAGPIGVPFKTITDLTALQQIYFDDGDASTSHQQVMDYIRGSNANESATGFRVRESRLGDIVNSTAIYMDGFLYAGANDGMLHAFDALTGQEAFSYVPSLIMPNLKYLAHQDYSRNHLFYVDNSPYAKEMGSKKYLVGGLGKGGKGYYCLDITDPATIGTDFELAARVKWEYPQADTPVGDDIDDVGFSYSRSYIVDSYADDDAVNGINYSDTDFEGYAVVFGNGYGSTNGNAVLYFLDPKTGSLIKKIDVGYGPGNGLGTPVIVDTNNDFMMDYIYAGDLKGNLWKFDVTDPNPDNWQVAYCDDGNDVDSCKNSIMPKPLFTTRSNRPITAKPDVMEHCDKDGFMVIFGTGRFLDELDWKDTTTQAIYGIWDYGDDDDDTEYLGEFNIDNTLSNMASTATLLEQTAIFEGDVTQNEQGDTISEYLRVLSQNEADWTTTADVNTVPTSDALEDPTAHVGWYFDLPLTGERVAGNVMIRDGKAIVTSFVLEDDRCTAGAESLIHEMDPCTGGRLDYSVFDIDDTGTIGAGDYILLDLDGDPTTPDVAVPPTATKRPGRLQPPAILRKDDGTEIKYFSSSNASIQMVTETAEKRGIYYWRQN